MRKLTKPLLKKKKKKEKIYAIYVTVYEIMY